MNQKIISFYLPQFHPIKENNKWWGNGFTEWTNVAQARPRFKDHFQPQIPADLGFYDLRLEETRIQQAVLAKEYGISGFCYYHYWFNGKMLLDRPFNEVLKSGKPDFPFCLCWANENWTRAWDGLDRQVLIKQDYTQEDAEAHIDWFINVFKDPRYIKINNRPILLIYRPDHIPEPEKMIKMWRDRALKAGLKGLYLCGVKNGFITTDDETLLKQGYDAVVDFQPNRNDFPRPSGLRQWTYRMARKFLPEACYQALKLRVSACNCISYRTMIERLIAKKWPHTYRKFPTIFPSWDNSARRKSPTIIQNKNPSVYGQWLKDSMLKVSTYPEEEQIVFINAWNEWAEGCHLEPDMRFKKAFLKETLAAKKNADIHQKIS